MALAVVKESRETMLWIRLRHTKLV